MLQIEPHSILKISSLPPPVLEGAPESLTSLTVPGSGPVLLL